MSTSRRSAKHIRLTSHPVEGGHGALPIRWGRADPRERGPIIGSTSTRSQRNVIGTHSGSYGVYRALAVAAGGRFRGGKPLPTQKLADRPPRSVSCLVGLPPIHPRCTPVSAASH